MFHGVSFMLVKQDLRCFFIIVLQSDDSHDKINKSEFFEGIVYSFDSDIRDAHCSFTIFLTILDNCRRKTFLYKMKK